MSKTVVGMIGKAGAGKDTVGDYLCANYGFKRVAFADPLKEGVKAMFMLTDEQAYDRVEREKPLELFPEWSPRKLYQYFGTELLRQNFDDDIWIKLLKKSVENIDSDRVIITDMRFPNELKELKSYSNSHALKVVRPNHIGLNVGIANHASEIHDLQGDYILNNDGTIEDLYKTVDIIMEKILNGHV